MSNLDHLRNQAKLYLRWHRDGYFPVAAQIRSWLPRYQHLGDGEILAAAFRLKDAQELVARKSGFESWPALIKGHSPMTDPTPHPQTGQTLVVEPQLFAQDLDRTRAFYAEKLGFAVAFAYGEPPFYMQMRRGGAHLNFRLVDGPVFDAGFREREGDVLCATLALDDAKALFLEFREAGVAFQQSLRDEPWGARTFIVRDPDGNAICFAGRAG